MALQIWLQSELFLGPQPGTACQLPRAQLSTKTLPTPGNLEDAEPPFLATTGVFMEQMLHEKDLFPNSGLSNQKSWNSVFF